MATQTLVVVHSDLSGRPEASKTQFAYLGTEYEIDLTTDERAQLEAVFAPYIAVARRVGGRRQPINGARMAGAQARVGTDAKTIRGWLRSQGVECPERGRIPVQLQEMYVARHTGHTNGSAPVEPAPVVEEAPEPPAKKATARKSVPAQKAARKPVASPEFIAPPGEGAPPARRVPRRPRKKADG